MAGTAAELAGILKRLQQLEDERAIAATLRNFCVAADHGSAAQWLQCFADDSATLEIQGPKPLLARFLPRKPETTETGGLRFAGQEALASFINGRKLDPAREQKHHTTHPLIDIEGGTARAQSYFLCTVYSRDQMSIEGMGRYIDQLVRCTDGVWRLVHRLIVCGPSDSSRVES